MCLKVERRQERLKTLFLVAAAAFSCEAQTLRDCKTVYLEPMPEFLDQFVSAELFKWGTFKVIKVKDKADCLLSFERPTSRAEVKSTGSAVIPKETVLKGVDPDEGLPTSDSGKVAALELVHRASSTVVWADSQKGGGHWLTGVAKGPETLARKLIDQLKKDYQKMK